MLAWEWQQNIRDDGILTSTAAETAASSSSTSDARTTRLRRAACRVGCGIIRGDTVRRGHHATVKWPEKRLIDAASQTKGSRRDCYFFGKTGRSLRNLGALAFDLIRRASAKRERTVIRVPRKSFRKDFFPARATANWTELALQAAILVPRKKHWMLFPVRYEG